MDSTLIVTAGLILVSVLAGSVGVTLIVLQSGRTSREAMATLEGLFKQHTISLENLKAIETGPEGMRGVVARSLPTPHPTFPDSLGDEPDEPEKPAVPFHKPPETYIEIGPGFIPPEMEPGTTIGAPVEQGRE